MPVLYLVKNSGSTYREYDWAIQLEWSFELEDMKGEPGDFMLEFSEPHQRIILKKEEFMKRYGNIWQPEKE